MRKGVLAALALLIAACGSGDTGSTIPSTTETTVLQPPRQPSSSSSVPADEGGVPAGFVSDVRADAAQVAGVDVTEVVVLEERAVEWPDGSLGCPQLGILYTQVITPGYQVVVSAGDLELDYRLDRRGGFRICETPAVPDVRDPGTSIPGSSSTDS